MPEVNSVSIFRARCDIHNLSFCARRTYRHRIRAIGYRACAQRHRIERGRLCIITNRDRVVTRCNGTNAVPELAIGADRYGPLTAGLTETAYSSAVTTGRRTGTAKRRSTKSGSSAFRTYCSASDCGCIAINTGGGTQKTASHTNSSSGSAIVAGRLTKSPTRGTVRPTGCASDPGGSACSGAGFTGRTCSGTIETTGVAVSTICGTIETAGLGVRTICGAASVASQAQVANGGAVDTSCPARNARSGASVAKGPT
ncbi:MAG: hypothetical protein Pars92KO_10360 [Parasphingorhabdus sp.]